MSKKVSDPGKLVYIPIGHINPHPDNPRKDLGDLTELVESIKSNGILQNLTVVPYYSKVHCRVIDGLYTVIIGHRRHAAANLAGLTELPCIIADMTEEEQISTMLVENMQRTDLTVYEQAKSFQQLSIDFGKSNTEIAAMSGFSEATVRKRTKLAEYDEKKVKKGCERGATLFDFEKLSSIEDAEDREKCLDAIGTPNFENTLRTAKDRQRWRTKKVKWIEQLSEFATQIEQRNYVGGEYTEMNYYINYGSWTRGEDVIVPSDANEAKYWFVVHDNQIDVYREPSRTIDPEQKRREEAREKSETANKQLNAISARHRALREDFIKNYGAAKSNFDIVLRNACDTIFDLGNRHIYGHVVEHEKLAQLLGIPYSKDLQDVWTQAFNAQRSRQPERTLLVQTYVLLDTGTTYIDRHWDSERQIYTNLWKDNQRLDKVYYLLEELGYQTSDEELQMRRGTHPLFDKED